MLYDKENVRDTHWLLYKAQQLVSCLPCTRDGQGKFDTYDVQLRGEKSTSY